MINIPVGDFYSCFDGDHLTHEVPSEAVEEYIQYYYEPGDDPEEYLLVPVELKVYNLIEATDADLEREAEHIAENIAERWDEQYGNPDGYLNPDPDTIKELQKNILPAITEFYKKNKPWTCEEIARITLDANQIKELLA